MEQVMNALVNGLVVVIATLISAVATGLTSYIKNKSDEYKAKATKNNYATAQAIASSAVLATEQVAKRLGLNGQQKLNKAVSYLEVELNKLGIHLTEQQQRMLVEASVGAMNQVGATVNEVVTLHE